MQAGGEATKGASSPSSLSRTRSLEPQVVGEALADDTRTATPPRGEVENVVTSPPVADARVDTPPHTADAGGSSAGVLVRDQLLTPKFGKESDLWVQLGEESVRRKEGFFR
jgi:hypothetical protein